MATTLEILAPYLPYGIEMAFDEAPNDLLGRGLQLRAATHFTAPHQVAIGHRVGDSFDWYPYDMVLPVLRPFSALCEPLEDGTVPAVEVAKIVYSDANQGLQGFGYKVNWTSAKVKPGFNDNGGWLNLEYLGGATPGPSLRFSNRGSWWQVSSTTDSSVGNPLAIADYLRRHHFAVGLEAAQFIEKLSAPIQEGTPAREKKGQADAG